MAYIAQNAYLPDMSVLIIISLEYQYHYSSMYYMTNDVRIKPISFCALLKNKIKN